VKVVLNRALPPSPRSALFDFMLLAVCLAFSIVCAALLFLWVEKPLSWSVPAKKPLPEVRPVAEPLQPERVTGTVA
jgi:peptidoglycan/LPS O-acetylase OafA/YrhL